MSGHPGPGSSRIWHTNSISRATFAAERERERECVCVREREIERERGRERDTGEGGRGQSLITTKRS